MIVFLYSILLFLFSVYSYALIDVNLTLINNKYWTSFRNMMVDFGYFHRDQSAIVFLIFIILLFIFNWYFIKQYKKINILLLTLITGGILLFSYPFLSHDLFSYIFDAKIVTQYHQNPYLMRPQDFPGDQWLRFLHWTHRTYPYGPTFLVTTLIPSFFAGTKFILQFLFFKLMFVIFYFLGVWSLRKLNKKWAVIFATHPLILVEGLMNSHNDLLSVSFSLLGIYSLLSNKNIIISRLLLVYSAGIKFITVPLLFLTKKYNLINQIVICLFIGLMAYVSFTREIQPWYFLSFFAFLPFSEGILMQYNILSFGLLAGYYLFIRYGVTNIEYQAAMKNSLLYLAFILNCAVIFWRMYVKKIPTNFNRYGLLLLMVGVGLFTRFIILSKTIVITMGNTRFFSLTDPNLLALIIPSLFIFGILILIFIRQLSFWTKTYFLLIVVFSEFLLFYTRTFTIDGLIAIVLLIFIELYLLVIRYTKNNKIIIIIVTIFVISASTFNTNMQGTMIRGFLLDSLLLAFIFDQVSKRNEFFKRVVILILIVFAYIGPVRYFLKDFGLKTLYFQNNIVGSIAEHKKVWEHNQRLNKKPFELSNSVRLKIFPEGKDDATIKYLLKQKYNLNVSDKGILFIICFNNLCDKKFYMDGALKRGHLILPNKEKISFDEAIIIYEEPGKIEVYGFR